jgi:hypothetical protein
MRLMARAGIAAAVAIATAFLGGCIGFSLAWLLTQGLHLADGPPTGVLLVFSVLGFAGAAGLLGLLATLRWISKKGAVIVLAAVCLLVVGAGVIDFFVNSYGPPLTRREALGQANALLQDLSRQDMTGGTVPQLAQEQYDPDKKTWMFTFRNDHCVIDVISDRLQGAEVGGMTKGCDTRSGPTSHE